MKSKSTKLDKIIHKVALDNMLPDRIVEMIFDSAIEFTANKIKEGEDTIRLIGLGIFYPKKRIRNKK